KDAAVIFRETDLAARSNRRTAHLTYGCESIFHFCSPLPPLPDYRESIPHLSSVATRVKRMCKRGKVVPQPRTKFLQQLADNPSSWRREDGPRQRADFDAPPERFLLKTHCQFEPLNFREVEKRLEALGNIADAGSGESFLHHRES